MKREMTRVNGQSEVDYLQIFKAWVINKDTGRYIRGILDGGSQRSFIQEDLAQRLNLKILQKTKLKLNTFGSTTSKELEHSNVVEVRLKSQFDDSECLIEAVTIPVICQDIAAQISEDSFVEFLRLQTRNLADDTVVPEVQVTPGISLLIGSDQVWKILTGEVVRCKESEGLVAVNTKIGWTLQGPSIPKGILTSASTLMVCVLNTQTLTEDEITYELLKAFWELDAMGILAKEAADDNLSLCAYFEENVVKDGQRYEVAFPWKEDCTEPLQNNRDIAVSRLRSLLR